ncbi:MAG: flagellar assembly protein T N-terminal domain-containing protein [Deltaproteobacteria bacterium]|nr:flagellar assembly protein T N-terminal domain-containing protein [Deltaproteobacteria bacterium]
MKRAVILAVVAGLLCTVLPAVAQTKIQATGSAVVDGNRVDVAREKALDGALRSAVEKVVGIMLTSTSEVENYALKMDRILSESRGFINTYAILSERRQGDLLDLVVEADVGRERLKDRMQAIQLIMARKAKPRLMLLFTERAQKDAIAEAAMSRYFMGKGFKLIDAQSLPKERSGEILKDPKSSGRLAGQYGAEVLLIGAVDAATSSFNVGGIEMHSNKVTVSVKVINGDTGEVITTDSKSGSAPGMKGDIRKITEEAAEKLARQMMEEVLERWSAELTNTATVKLVVSGLDNYETLQQFKDLLASRVKGFKEVQQRTYRRGEAEMDVELRGDSRSLADDLALMTLSQKKLKVQGVSATLNPRKVEITAITANRVDARVQP